MKAAQKRLTNRGSGLDMRVGPRDKPNVEVDSRAAAMQEKLGVAEDPGEHLRLVDNAGKSKIEALDLVPWRDTLPYNIFDAEPAKPVDDAGKSKIESLALVPWRDTLP